MKAVVFDLDGTLIDSAPDIHAASEKMLGDIGLPALPYEQVKSFIGNGVPKLVERIMQVRDLTGEDTHARLVEAFLAHYNAAPADKTTLYPNLRQVLGVLRNNGIALGVCTNKPEAPTRAILSAFDLDHLFDVVVGGDKFVVKKPDPAPLIHAFDVLNATERLFVGDSEVDAETAERAGISFVLFTKGYRKAAISDLTHKYSFDSFGDLAGIVSDAFSADA